MSATDCPERRPVPGHTGTTHRDSPVLVVQQLLPFNGTKEQQRADRCRRLLEGLGQPATKIATAAEFDYQAATRIARGQK